MTVEEYADLIHASEATIFLLQNNGCPNNLKLAQKSVVESLLSWQAFDLFSDHCDEF